MQQHADQQKRSSLKAALSGICDEENISVRACRLVKEDGVRFMYKMREFYAQNDPVTVQLLLDGFVAQCCIGHVAHLGMQSLLCTFLYVSCRI